MIPGKHFDLKGPTVIESAKRDLRLTLRAHGAVESIRVIGDYILAPELFALRIHGTGFSAVPDARPEFRNEKVVVVMCADGEGTATYKKNTFSLTPGKMLIFDPSTPCAFEFRRTISLYAIRLSRAAIRIGETHSPLVLASNSLYERTTWALLNNILNETAAGLEFEFEGMVGALESLIATNVTEGLSLTFGAHQKPNMPTFEHGQRIIRDNYTNPAFNVDMLAVELNTSRGQVHRIFAQNSTTPAAEIRARRVEHALKLSATDTESGFSGRIARLAGFGSLRRLRRAVDLLEDSS